MDVLAIFGVTRKSTNTLNTLTNRRGVRGGGGGGGRNSRDVWSYHEIYPNKRSVDDPEMSEGPRNLQT